MIHEILTAWPSCDNAGLASKTHPYITRYHDLLQLILFDLYSGTVRWFNYHFKCQVLHYNNVIYHEVNGLETVLWYLSQMAHFISDKLIWRYIQWHQGCQVRAYSKAAGFMIKREMRDWRQSNSMQIEWRRTLWVNSGSMEKQFTISIRYVPAA